eukprot:9313950-Ditylum_brightwellii.AAC.1
MPMPAATPDKHLRPFPAQNGETEFSKKQRKTEKKGWLRKLTRGSFCQPVDISVTYCIQHIILGHSCRYQLKNGSCNFQRIE